MTSASVTVQLVAMCSAEEGDDGRRRREHEETLSGLSREIHNVDLVQHIPALRQTQQVAAQFLGMDVGGNSD